MLIFANLFWSYVVLGPEEIDQIKKDLEEKLHKYTVIWPALKEPPIHLPIKLAVGVPYILRALRRIEDGTYGICEDCDEEIPLARLKLVPGANRCVPCQNNADT